MQGALKKTYHIWYSMIWRCKQTTGYYHKYYKDISVCQRWHDFNNFIEDMGLQPEGMSLERIDNDNDYQPSNVRWATMKEQSQNRRNSRFITVGANRLTVSQWSDKLAKYGIGKWSVQQWSKQGDDYFIKRVKSLQVT